jgi:hypothetical protein
MHIVMSGQYSPRITTIPTISCQATHINPTNNTSAALSLNGTKDSID